MSHSAVVVFKEKGKVLPDAFLEKVLKENPSGFGYAFCADDQPGEVLVSPGASATLEEVKEVQNTFDSSAILFCFCKTDNTDTTDVQPFKIITDDKEKVLLAGVLEGEYTIYGEPKSPKPASHFALFKHVGPRLNQLHRLVKGDVNGFIEELSSQVQQDEFTSMSLKGEHSVIALMFPNGKVLTFTGNCELSEFPWGWTSNTYGYTETAELSAKDRMKAILAKKKAEKAATSDTKEAVVEKEVDLPITATKTDTAVPDNVYVQCPKEINGNKNIRNFYIKHAGFQPSGYKKKPKVLVQKKTNETIKDLKDPRLAAVATDPDKERTKVGGTTIIRASSSKEPDDLPIIPTEQIKDIRENFLQRRTILDASSQKIPDPKSIQDREAKWPSFTEKAGISLEDTLNWPFPELVVLAKTNPEGYVKLSMEWRYEFIKLINGPAKVWLERNKDRKAM